jgi:Clp amino terminal domain, pathogenicity island component
MFERYTEKARRCIFFARYEASEFGATEIDAHHLLLGVLRESHVVTDAATSTLIREQIERQYTKQPRISTSIDIPLSADSKRALNFAAEQAEAHDSRFIDWPHLLLGIMRLENSFPATLLANAGIDPAAVKQVIADVPVETHLSTASKDLDFAVERLRAITPRLPLSSKVLARSVEIDGEPVTLVRGLGYLINCACAFQSAAAFSPPRWPDARDDHSLSPLELIQIWTGLNRVIARRLSFLTGEEASAQAAPAAAYITECERILASLLDPH